MYRFVIPALLLACGSVALSADISGYEARQAARDQADLARELAGLVPGKPQACIDPRRFVNLKRFNDTLLYVASGREVYRNDVVGGCLSRRRDDAILTRDLTGQLCRGDTVRTLDPISRIPGGSCVFGDFVPYRRP